MTVELGIGYTADIIGRHGMLEPGVEFLPKPYVLSDLSRRVRECIDNQLRIEMTRDSGRIQSINDGL